MIFKVLLVLLLPVALLSQEACFLGVGCNTDEWIAKTFVLTEEQRKKLRNYGAELHLRNAIFETRAKNFLKRHAESSPDELMKMAPLYRVFLDSMHNNRWLVEKRMLGALDTEQYNLYIMLCNKLQRRPIYRLRSSNEN